MLSFNDRLKLEVARRDHAMKASKQHLSNIADTVGGTYRDVKTSINDVKTSLRPKNIVEGLKTEYDPARMISHHPWGSIAGALAAGFAIVPIIRAIMDMFPMQPKPPPQHIVIEVAGAPGTPAKVIHKKGEPVKHSMVDTIAEVIAMMGGLKNVLNTIRPHSNGVAEEAQRSAVTAESTPASATISRRYAPPPTES
jgi:hypothetical protein